MSTEENIPGEMLPDKPPLIKAVNEPEEEQQLIQTIDMEVHKHPHHVTHKKKWGEYLLEFFMLFLAVFLGFLAENYRESLVNKEKEKHYMENLVGDLRADTAALNRTMDYNGVLDKNARQRISNCSRTAFGY